MSLLNTLPVSKSEKAVWPWNKEFHPHDSLIAYPKITIITPSYNQGQFIEETIRSILLQNYPNLEYIVIDGGSTDNSVEIIKKYSKWITYWTSEKDSGQPEAINKGLKVATGEIANWINSDDVLEEGALFKIAELYNKTGFSLLAGVVKEFSSDGSFCIVRNKNLTPQDMILHQPQTTFHQPGVWFLLKNFWEIAGIAEKYHYCFDWHLFIRYLSHFPEVVYTDDVLVNFRLHENSKTVSVPVNFQQDNIAIADELKELPSFSGIKRDLEYYVKMKSWYVWLLRLQAEKKPKSNKVIKVIQASFTDPRNRWSRYTLGAIKNILLS